MVCLASHRWGVWSVWLATGGGCGLFGPSEVGVFVLLLDMSRHVICI